ncbi:hypothetical protein BKA65DRAFT_510818 [Rhexocercosporidium sp. MPI-PUGE-AT-0058]|nr:hypothetical protein BKA65DRAFT_510818 [Rhexocercosporidium sp. MPI-PUGE-AT-0058]
MPMAPADLHYCTQILLSSPGWKRSNTPVYDATSIPTRPIPSSLAGKKELYWEHGTKLRVKFNDKGQISELVKDKVRKYAKIWEEYANIRFDFVDEGDAEIRISFEKGKGSWSYVGTESVLAELKDQPSMNFGWLDDWTPDHEFARVVLHEFGHALGCVHEHQRPDANIPWDKNKAIEYFMKENSWTNDQVEKNIFFCHSAEEIESSEPDKLSIMMYQYPKTVTTDGSSQGENVVLSQKDKDFIAKVYPMWLGNTCAIPESAKSAILRYGAYHYQAPHLALGICGLHIEKSQCLCAGFHVEDATPSGACLVRDRNPCFDVTNPVDMTWFDVDVQDGDIQAGEVSFGDRHGATENFQTKVTFPRKFNEKPMVVIWLKEICIPFPACSWRIKAIPQEATESAFSLYVSTWNKTRLRHIGVSWIAYSASKSKIQSGIIDTCDFRKWEKYVPKEKGRIVFDKGVFGRKPSVLLGISKFDLSTEQKVNFRAFSSDVSTEGFDWNIEYLEGCIGWAVMLHWVAVQY